MTRQIPMLFSPAMVNALLSGRKTETRRILKPQPETYKNEAGKTCDIYPFKVEGEARSRIASGFNSHGVITTQKCRAEIGDLIWVRESWRIGAWRAEHWARGNGECDAEIAVDYLADNHARKEWLKGSDPEMMLRLMEQSRHDAKSDGSYKQDAEFQYRWPPGQSPCRARPSIHMPKFASRMTLRVTSFGIERLNNITEAGAISEGVQSWGNGNGTFYGVPGADLGMGEFYRNPIEAYAALRNTINGTDAWMQNPWVDVTKFEVINQNIKGIAT